MQIVMQPPAPWEEEHALWRRSEDLRLGFAKEYPCSQVLVGHWQAISAPIFHLLSISDPPFTCREKATGPSRLLLQPCKLS